jgi:hypothetical protein
MMQNWTKLMVVGNGVHSTTACSIIQVGMEINLTKDNLRF